MRRTFFISLTAFFAIIALPHATQNQDFHWRNVVHALSPTKLPKYVVHRFEPDSKGISVQIRGDYDSLKLALLGKREALRREYQAASDLERIEVLNRAGAVFTESLLNGIIPHWYGTEWDFNGYTDVPGSGQIACGYFVSTTLKHLGLNVNRYKLAQAYSLKTVEVLQGGRAINVSGVGQDSFVNYMAVQKDGMYVVGLDHHTGFICKRRNEVYFIHSSNLWPGTVCIESARKTIHFRWSNSFVVADLSNNSTFIRKWLVSEEFTVSP